MISSQWKNVATVVTCVLLMLVAMVQIILALALNLRSSMWVEPTNVLVEERTRLATGVNILIDSLFIFPAAWTGICAAVSRHRGVYIAMVVITSLAFLGEIGGLVELAWEFGTLNLFRDSGSVNDEMAIALLVMQSLILLVTIAVLVFGVIALMPDMSKDRRAPPFYQSGPGHVNSAYTTYPRATGYPASTVPARQGQTLGDYRPLTRGSPEWDRFYDQYFATGRSYSGDDYRRRPKHRSNSYRY